MSLSRKLWLAILIVLAFVYSGSLIVSLGSAQKYLKDQLYLKNLDNASSLALSMSQSSKDPVEIEVLLSAQFDTGHYKYIELINPNGETLFSRKQELQSHETPEWFRALVSLEVDPGIAQVQDGWNQFGTIELKSHDGIAYRTLWNEALVLLGWILVTGLATGLLGTKLMQIILRPLDQIVRQAQAIGERRFIRTEEPHTIEFKKVVRSMNALSERIHFTVDQEAGRMEALRKSIQIDETSGLYKREYFLNLFDARLNQSNEESTGVLVIFRIKNINELNREIGWEKSNELLAILGEYFKTLLASYRHWAVGKLSGTDFGVLATGAYDYEEIYKMIVAEVSELLIYSEFSNVVINTGATYFLEHEQTTDVLARADSALAKSEDASFVGLNIEPATIDSGLPVTQAEWNKTLDQALQAKHVQLAEYPVVDISGNLIHYESPIRAYINDEWRNAGSFIHWAGRLDKLELLDSLVLQAAIQKIQTTGKHISVNLSNDALQSSTFLKKLVLLFDAHEFESSKLNFDIPEYHAMHLPNQFRNFCEAIKPYKCEVGLKHTGPQFSLIGDMHDIGLDYIKIDASITKNIDFNVGNQSFVRGICLIAHSIGIRTYAEGVVSEIEYDCLATLGIDGMTGPYVKI